jgi:dihydropteroate synthase
VLPVIRELAARTNALLSVDTYKAPVARAALDAGAAIVNDITGLGGDPDMSRVVRDYDAGAIVMHMQGNPRTMQLDPQYGHVVADIGGFFQARLQVLSQAGIAREHLVLDPGIGFGKTAAHNLQLLSGLEAFKEFGRPVCLGVSRKGFFGTLLGRPKENRLAASLAAVCYTLSRGSAQLFRVHDVAATRDAVKLFETLDAARFAGSAFTIEPSPTPAEKEAEEARRADHSAGPPGPAI